MDFNLSDLQRMLLDSAERLIGDRYTLEHRRALRSSEAGVDRDGWASFADLGWLALAIPEAKGGLGGSLTDVAVLMTVFGRKLVPDPFVSSAVLAASILAQSDCDDALAAIASGESLIALAHGEPDERYPSGARRAVLTPAGGGYRLSGRKSLVADAGSADRLLVAASTGEGEGTAIVLVDRAAEGVSATIYPLVDGTRAGDLVFTDVAVAQDALIVPPDCGEAVLETALDRARVALMAQAVGAMEECLALSANYIKERRQFGQPIGNFQALQHIMADMLVAAHQARSALYQALASAEADPLARARAVSLARIIVDEAARFISSQAIQLHGGYGVTDEYEVSHHYRRLLVLSKSYGDTDFHAGRVAESL